MYYLCSGEKGAFAKFIAKIGKNLPLAISPNGGDFETER